MLSHIRLSKINTEKRIKRESISIKLKHKNLDKYSTQNSLSLTYLLKKEEDWQNMCYNSTNKHKSISLPKFRRSNIKRL